MQLQLHFKASQRVTQAAPINNIRPPCQPYSLTSVQGGHKLLYNRKIQNRYMASIISKWPKFQLLALPDRISWPSQWKLFLSKAFFIFSKVLLFYFYKQNSVRSVIFIVMKKGACADNIFYIFQHDIYVYGSDLTFHNNCVANIYRHFHIKGEYKLLLNGPPSSYTIIL